MCKKVNNIKKIYNRIWIHRIKIEQKKIIKLIKYDNNKLNDWLRLLTYYIGKNMGTSLLPNRSQ